MEKSFLTEAFKQLQILDEEDYQLNDNEDIKDMKDTLFNDLDDDSIDVIDPEAYSEDELSDSYVGKVILDCEVCHSKIYKNPDEIVIDEESQLANIEDECPYCMSNDGYKIIGEVAPFNEDSEDDDEDDEHEDDDEDDEDKEDLDETFGSELIGKGIGAAAGAVLGGPTGAFIGNKVGSAIGDAIGDFKLKKDVKDLKNNTNESLSYDFNPDIIDNSASARSFNDFVDVYAKLHKNPNAKLTPREKALIDVFSNYEDEYSLDADNADDYIDKLRQNVKKGNELLVSIANKVKNGERKNLTKDERNYLNRNGLHIYKYGITDDKDRELVDFENEINPNYNYLGKYASRVRPDGKRDPDYVWDVKWDNDRDINTGKRIKDSDFYMYNKLHRTFQDKERAYNAAEMHDKSSVDLIGYKPMQYQISQENDRHQEKIDKLTNSYNQKVQELQLDSENSGIDNSKKLSTLEKRYNSYIARENKQHEDNINKINADADEWLKRVKEERKNKYLARRAERQNNINSSDLIDNQLEFDKDGELTEELEKIEVNTDDEVVAVDQDENHININVSKKDDMIAPVSQETKAEINNDNPKDNSEDDFVDYDIDDFDEESFDDLGESYLKKVYENVNSFKTTGVSSKGNTLTVEGLIKFNSGKEKATQFIFESNSASNNKLNFIGGNKQISRGKKSFNLKGQLKENKFFAESLVYNYRAKLDEGKSQRVYGRVKHSLTEKTSVDLSEIQGSIANLIKERHNELDDCKSVSELTRKLTTMLDDANIHTPAANRLLSRVASKKSVNDALTAIYNSFLSGANLSVIS